MSLEVLKLPVTNMNASVWFHRVAVDFVLDHDLEPGEGCAWSS